MLNTRFKSKLPKGLSYPLGAQQISNALIDVPQYDDLSVTFMDCPHGSAAGFHDALQDGLPVPVVVVTYHNHTPGLSASNEGIEKGWYGESWDLTVYPVRSDTRAEAIELIVSSGLPKVAKWLSKPRPQTWREGHRYFIIYYSSARRCAMVRETTTYPETPWPN